jgi:hypothetical protein
MAAPDESAPKKPDPRSPPKADPKSPPKVDPKSPPPRSSLRSQRGTPDSQRSHRQLSSRQLSSRVKEHAQREEGHEAFGLAPPPTRSEIGRMMCATVVRTLDEYKGNAECVKQVCERWCALNEAGRREATEAGALQAIVSAVKSHAADASVMEKAIGAIGTLCYGTDEAGLARKQLAADSGAIPLILAAMVTHASVAAVVENGAATIGNIVSNVDEPGLSRKQAASDEGALEAIVGGAKAHKESDSVQDCCFFALANLVRGRGDKDASADEAGAARKQRAVDAGAILAIIDGMQEHMDKPRVQESGSRAISNITFRNEAYKKAAMDAGAMSDWLDGACTARVFVPDPEHETPGAAGRAEGGEEAVDVQ